MLIKCLLVGLGGFVGSVLRYLIGLIPINENHVFPINTFIINIMGAFAIGFIAFYVTKGTNLDERLILFLKVGVCGGFTTFSTFALETSDLIKNGNMEIALLYVVLSVVIGTIAVFIPELILK